MGNCNGTNDSNNNISINNNVKSSDTNKNNSYHFDAIGNDNINVIVIIQKKIHCN